MMADPLGLVTSLVNGLISRVKEVKVNLEQCQLLADLAKQTLNILQQLEERVFDSSVATALDLVVSALREANDIVEKCCKSNFFYAALYHENYTTALKQAAERLEHALSQIPLASLGMTADIQSDIVEIKAQIRNAKFEERATVVHHIQDVRDAMERAFNQTGQGNDEVKGLIQELVQEHSSSKEELRNELVVLKQFAFEAKENKEKQQEFELNQLILVLSESLGDVNEAPRVTHDLEDCHRCPISKEIMRDPVVLKDSCMIYDRSSITEWLRRGHRHDPLTNIELVCGELVPNHALRDACQIILEQSGDQSSTTTPRPHEEEEEEEEVQFEQHIQPGLYEGHGKFFVGSTVVHASQLMVFGPNGKVVGCTLYMGEILGIQENNIDIGAGGWDVDTHEFSFGDCQFNYNGNVQLKTDVHQRGITWSGRVSKGDALDEEYNFSLAFYPPSIEHAIPAHPTILEMESKVLTIYDSITSHSKAVLSLERDSSVAGWISFESHGLEFKSIGCISRGSWNENGSLTFSVFFPPNDTPLNSDLRPTNYEACYSVSGTLTHGQKFPCPSFSGIFMKTQEQGASGNGKAMTAPLDGLRMVEYPIIREASTPWYYLLQNPLKIFQLSRNFELEQSQSAISEKLDARYGLILHSQRAFGMSPLHVASSNNSIDLVKELIAQGADINFKDKNGQSPLHHAAFTNSVDVVKELVSKDADIDLQDKFGKSPLHVALHKKSTLIIKELLDNGANVDLQDDNGSTLLHYAVFNNSIEVIKLLNSKSANVDIQDKFGRSPLHIAFDENNNDAIEELLNNGANIDLRDDNGWSKLHHASNQNDIETIKKLISKGANIDLQDNYGRTPLCIASEMNMVDIVKELIVKEANVNLQRKDGSSPLYIASAMNAIDVTKELLGNGSNVNIQVKNGFSALHIACLSNHVDVVKELIASEASINVQDINGMTPLHIASSWGQISTVHILLKHGASKETKNTMGHIPYDVMCAMELFGPSNEAIEELDMLLST